MLTTARHFPSRCYPLAEADSNVAEDALSDAPRSIRGLFKIWGAAAAGEVATVTSTDTPTKTKGKITFKDPSCESDDESLAPSMGGDR